MGRRALGERTYRRALAAGLLLSVAAHAVLFAYGRLTVESRGEAGRSLQLVQLPAEESPLDRPLEVVPLRDVSVVDGGASPAATSEISALPGVPRLTVALASAVPRPRLFLEPVEEPEEREDPVSSYASVSDFLVSVSPDPKPLRPIDGRPVEVLAAIGGRGPGAGIGIGGGHCPPNRPARISR